MAGAVQAERRPDGTNGPGHNGPAPTDGNGTGNGTFSGPGFGTLMMQMASGPKETPPVASTRAYLRNGLPALYQDGDFGMRFVGALEELLDPIVAVLDGAALPLRPELRPAGHPEPARGMAGRGPRRDPGHLATSARWSCARPSSAAGAAP